MLSETSADRPARPGRPWFSAVTRCAVVKWCSVPVAVLATLASVVGWHVSAAASPLNRVADNRPTYRAVQSGQRYRLAQGKFLVAGRELMDPNFAQTVVLLFHHDEEGSVGLIINRATDIKLSEAVDHFQQWEGEDDRLYQGGPVARQRVTMLIRTDQEIEGAHQVFDDVHLGAAKGLLQSLANGWDKPKAFRAYTGYAGWGAGQLEAEMKLKSWHVLPARADIVFDPDPDTVWKRLMEETDKVRWVRDLPNTGMRWFRPWAPG